MKKLYVSKTGLLPLIVFVVLGFNSCSKDKKPQTILLSKDKNIIFAKGKKVDNKNFTGEVWLNNLVQADSINQNAVGSVTFEPGSRTKWHSHPSGQIILAIDGVGYYQEKGSPKIIIKKGDVVKCPAKILHWHGASIDPKFIQVAITGRGKGETKWFEEVSKSAYQNK